MARFCSTVVFFPTALRRGTQRNAIQLKTCTRTTQTFFCTVENVRLKNGNEGLPTDSAAFIPTRKLGGLSPRFGKIGQQKVG